MNQITISYDFCFQKGQEKIQRLSEIAVNYKAIEWIIMLFLQCYSLENSRTISFSIIKQFWTDIKIVVSYFHESVIHFWISYFADDIK